MFHDSLTKFNSQGLIFLILGAFAKFRKATINFVTYVCLSVRPSAWNNSAPTERIFMKSVIWGFSKICQKIQVLLRSDKNNGYFTWRRMYIYDISLNSS
jgi:hypothetical protein